MKKRVLSILLCLALLAGLLPALGAAGQTAKAADTTYEDLKWVCPRSYDELKMALASDTDNAIKLNNDIELSISFHYAGDAFIDPTMTVHGNKVLDLNGFDLTVGDGQNVQGHHENYNKETIAYNKTLFSIPAGSSLTVLDTIGGSDVRFYGYYIGTASTDYLQNDKNSYYYIFTVSGELTINGGHFVAGGSKKQYLVGYAKNIYQVLSGAAVVVTANGRFTANGGSYEGNGYLHGAVYLQNNSHCVINDGTFTGASCANVFKLSDTYSNGDFDLCVKAGSFRTEKHDLIRIADYSRGDPLWKSGSYGCIGIPSACIPASAAVAQNNNDGYSSGESGDTTITPDDFATGSIIDASGYGSISYKIGTNKTVAFSFDTYFAEDSLLANPLGTGKLARSDSSLNRNGISGCYWELYKVTKLLGHEVRDSVLSSPYHTSGTSVDLRSLYSGWEAGTRYELRAYANEYFSGRSNSYQMKVSAAQRMQIRAIEDWNTIGLVELGLASKGQTPGLTAGEAVSGLKAGTALADYTLTFDDAYIDSAVITNWYTNTDAATPLPADTVVAEDTRYTFTASITTKSGYVADYNSLLELYGDCSHPDPGTIKRTGDRMTLEWSCEFLTPVIPIRVFVEGEELTLSNPLHYCSGGGTASFDSYSNTLTLDNANIFGGDTGGSVSHVNEAVTIVSDDAYASPHDYDYRQTLVTLALKGENTVTVDNKTYTLSDGSSRGYGTGILSSFSLQLVQADESGQIAFYGSATDSVYVQNAYDNPFTDKDDSDYIALYLYAPMEDFSDNGNCLDECGFLYIGGSGSYRGHYVDAWGLKGEKGFYCYETWKTASDRYGEYAGKAEFRYELSSYKTSDKPTYMEIGRDYKLTLCPDSRYGNYYPVYVNSANASDVFHDGGSVSYDPTGLPRLYLNNVSLQASSGYPAISISGYTNLVLKGDNTITMKSNATGIDAGCEVCLYGDGSLTIRAGEEGTVGDYGIYCQCLEIHTGSLIIRDCRQGIYAEGMLDAQTTRYIDYIDGLVSIYAPAVPGSTRNYAVNHAPDMGGGNWAGEWLCYAGNIELPTQYYDGSSDITGYRGLRLVRSLTCSTELKCTVTIDSDGKVSSDLQECPSGSIQTPFAETLKDADGYFVASALPGQTYTYTAYYELTTKANATTAATIANYKNNVGEVTLPVFYEDAVIGNVPASYVYVGANGLAVVHYTFTLTGTAATGVWKYFNGSSWTQKPLYADGQLILDCNGNTMSMNVDGSEAGLIVSIRDAEEGDLITLTANGFVAESKEVPYRNNDIVFSFYQLGDALCDAKLDLKDVSAIFRYCTGANALNAGGYKKLAADFNQDGSITLRDAAGLFRAIS